MSNKHKYLHYLKIEDFLLNSNNLHFSEEGSISLLKTNYYGDKYHDKYIYLVSELRNYLNILINVKDIVGKDHKFNDILDNLDIVIQSYKFISTNSFNFENDMERKYFNIIDRKDYHLETWNTIMIKDVRYLLSNETDDNWSIIKILKRLGEVVSKSSYHLNSFPTGTEESNLLIHSIQKFIYSRYRRNSDIRSSLGLVPLVK